MRDPLLRRAFAGLILAMPPLISLSSTGASASLAEGLKTVVLAESILIAGLGFASLSRRRLRDPIDESTRAESDLTPFVSTMKPGSLAG